MGVIIVREIFTACFLIIAAEMGDKSQILAMTFATKYSIRQVFIGISIGALLNHGIAVALGSALAKVIPLDFVRIVAGALFVIFALWTLANNEEELEEKGAKKFGPIITVASAFFIGEFGDKTQLAAITLSTTADNPLFILIGTVTGMIITSAIGILIGSRMGKRIPEFTMKLVSAYVFLFFGLIALYQNLDTYYLTPINIFIVIIALGLIVIYLTNRTWQRHKEQLITPLKAQAQALHEQLTSIKKLIDELCLTDSSCYDCGDQECPIKHAQENLNAYMGGSKRLPNKLASISELTRADIRKFNISKAREALVLTVAACENCRKSHHETCILNETRLALEKICFNRTLPFDGNVKHYLERLEHESPILASKVWRLVKKHL